MSNIALLGTQWGDEGKGKIIDLLTPYFDIVARWQGGHNAGHTVNIKGKEIILHLVPSGILCEDKKCVIGNGLVIDPEALLREIRYLEELGYNVRKNLLISDRAHLIFPHHRRCEDFTEGLRGKKKIDTTSRGIGPAYESKYAREGLRVIDLMNPAVLREKIHSLSDMVNRRFLEPCGLKPLDREALLVQYAAYGDDLREFIVDTSLFLNQEMDKGKSILFEGAQGTQLDIDHGTYPYVTSSSAVVGGACTGLGIGPTRIDGVLGVSKAYTTRVGAGPFPTELSDRNSASILERGHEYGATTGRERRCGWLDMVVLKYACRINHIDSLALTKLDVLDTFEDISICIGYCYKNSVIRDFPAESWILEACTPQYTTVKGWKADTSSLKEFTDLPEKAKDYIKKIEDLVETEVGLISTGAERDQTIIRKDSRLSRWTA